LAILRKPNLKNHVKILKNTNPDYQWIKLEKDYFGFQRDLFICVVYYPPCLSTYANKLECNILDEVEKELAVYSRTGDILICGDSNARVGTLPDLLVHDDKKFLPLCSSLPLDKDIMNRFSKDTTVDKRGKELIDFCKGCQMRILNGRTLGIMLGKFTCFTPNGSSVVDYAIVSESVLKSILYFNVSDFVPTLSDCHCRLEWEMSAKFIDCNSTIDEDHINNHIHPMLARYVWSDDSGTLFQDALKSQQIQTQISDFLNNMKYDSPLNINTASAKLANSITQAADMSLKKRRKKDVNNREKKT